MQWLSLLKHRRLRKLCLQLERVWIRLQSLRNGKRIHLAVRCGALVQPGGSVLAHRVRYESLWGSSIRDQHLLAGCHWDAICTRWIAIACWDNFGCRWKLELLSAAHLFRDRDRYGVCDRCSGEDSIKFDHNHKQRFVYWPVYWYNRPYFISNGRNLAGIVQHFKQCASCSQDWHDHSQYQTWANIRHIGIDAIQNIYQKLCSQKTAHDSGRQFYAELSFIRTRDSWALGLFHLHCWDSGDQLRSLG